MFPGSKWKAVTFSYDDGVGQDVRLTEILNRYGLRCTFNINTGIQSNAHGGERDGVSIRRLNMSRLPGLYRGHEIAVHCLTHPHLEDFDKETIFNEIHYDQLNIKRLFHQKVAGMAYPFGTYNDTVLDVLRETGILYARTTKSSHSFIPQDNLLEFQPTCHHGDAQLMDLAREFVGLETEEPRIFYIWGHSYEFDLNQNWDMFERFCDYIAGRDDIFYGTNANVLLDE